MAVTTLLLAMAVMPSASTAAGAAGPAFAWSASDQQPVIEYTLIQHMLAEQDPVPLLRIYGDGRVQVHRPAYLQNAGDYVMDLSPAGLEALLASLATDGVLDFDAAAMRSERKRQERDRRNRTGTLFQVSDAVDTLITVRLESYRRSPQAPLRSKLVKQFAWRNLEQDARHYPGAIGLVQADTSTRRLHALTEHPALQHAP